MQLLLVLLVAVLNLLLGYALAVKFGWELIGLRTPINDEDDDWEDDDSDVLPFEKPAAVPAVSDESKHTEEAEARTSADENRDSSDSEPDKSLLESSIEEILQRLEEFSAELYRTDRSLREAQEGNDAEAIGRLRTELLTAFNKYVSPQQEANNLLKDEDDQLGDLASLADRVESAADEHCENIDSSRCSIENQKSEEDAARMAGSVADEIISTLTSCYRLRDALHEVILDVAQREDRLGSLPDRVLADELTSVASRAGIAENIWRLWHADPDHLRPMSFALVSLDGLHRINKQYGPEAGDRVLRDVAGLVRDAVPEGLVGRFSGHQFAIVLPEITGGEAELHVERCRQTIENGRFQCEDAELQLSATCVVMAPTSDDTIAALLEKAEKFLEQTNLHAQNRTVLCEESETEPPDPGRLDIDDPVPAV